MLATAAVAALLLATPPATGSETVPGLRVETHGPPPAPLADSRAASPSPDAVWIEGYWQWTGKKWSWTAGEWTIPPGNPPYAWTPARWTSDERGWIFHEPFWRPTSGTPRDIRGAVPVAHATAPQAPPALLVEVRGRAPSHDAVWLPGFWAWTGSRFAWVSGEWSAPYPGHRWVEGSWKRGEKGFSWVPGRWRPG
jgi:hypothetical protein